MAKHSANEPNRLRWMGLSALVALVVVAGAVVISLIGGGEPETSEPQAPENQLLVSDLYEGERYVPKFEYPLNEYDTEGFTEQNGFIQYPGTVLGVDVSEHQGDIDWQAVRGAGVEFAILRVGYRGMTEGGLNVDATFEQNYQGAVDAGLQVGVYFFSQAVSQAEAREEADFVDVYKRQAFSPSP